MQIVKMGIFFWKFFIFDKVNSLHILNYGYSVLSLSYCVCMYLCVKGKIIPIIN